MSARNGQPFTLLPFIKCLQSEIALPKDPHTVVDAIARAMSAIIGVMIAGRKEGAPGRGSLRNCRVLDLELHVRHLLRRGARCEVRRILLVSRKPRPDVVRKLQDKCVVALQRLVIPLARHPDPILRAR